MTIFDTPAILTLAATDDTKLLIIGSCIVGGIILYKLIDTFGSTSKHRQSELTRRELAAYVAEGSMTPETAERLLTAGAPSNWQAHVAELVQSGRIDSEDAERLLQAGSHPPAKPASA